MVGQLNYERIGNETECGKILNTHFISPLRKGYVRVNGVVLADCYPEKFDQIRHFDVQNDDIFVCSFLKSGTFYGLLNSQSHESDLHYENYP